MDCITLDQCSEVIVHVLAVGAILLNTLKSISICTMVA